MGMFDRPPYYVTAYGLAVQHGFQGTEEQWLASLNGESAYEQAKKGGYTGTEQQFNAMLAGISAQLAAIQTQIAGIVAGMVPDGSITAAKIKDGEVKTAELDDGAVTTAKLDGKAVTTAKLDDLAVTAEKLAADAVETAKIKDGAVTYGKTAGIQKQHGTIANLSVPAITPPTDQTVTAEGVGVNSTVLVSPTEASWAKWRDCGVRCKAQGANQLVFAAESATGEAISVNVLILD